MPDGTLKKIPTGFLICSESEGIFDYILNGESVLAKITRARNLQYHKKFFAFLKIVFENQDRFQDMEKMRAYITVRAGYYTVAHKQDSTYALIPDSISFASMDDVKFREFFSKCVDVVVHQLIKGMTAQDLNNKVEQIIMEFG